MREGCANASPAAKNYDIHILGSWIHPAQVGEFVVDWSSIVPEIFN